MTKRPLDLSGPLAKLDWADGQIPTVEAAQADLVAKNTRRTLCVGPGPDGRNHPFVRTAIDNFTAPDALTAHIGAIIHAQRTALDFLICELSERNGAPPNRKPYFPIRQSEELFTTDGNVRKDMRDLTEPERAILVGLKPWRGGHDHIYLMHELDLMDKHRKLIVASRHISELSIEGSGWIQSIGWRKEGEDVRVSMIQEGSVDLVPTVELAIRTESSGAVSLVRTLHDFGAATRGILKLFEAEAAREAAAGS